MGPVGPEPNTTNHLPLSLLAPVLSRSGHDTLLLAQPVVVRALILTMAGPVVANPSPLSAAGIWSFENSQSNFGFKLSVTSIAKYEEYPLLGRGVCTPFGLPASMHAPPSRMPPIMTVRQLVLARLRLPSLFSVVCFL